MEPLGLAFSKCCSRVVVDGAASSSIFKVPPARGSGSDVEPLGLASCFVLLVLVMGGYVSLVSVRFG